MKLLRALLLLLAIGVAAVLYVYIRLTRPYEGFGKETFVEIPHGTSARRIAEMLRNAGVIRNEWEFLLVRSIRGGAHPQAGEYRFTKADSPMGVFDRIARGDIFYFELKVPEGKNMFDVAGLAEQLGLFPAEKFLAVARNPQLIRDLDPRAPSLEGYLFPSTYRVGRHATPASVSKLMTNRFREVWRGLNTKADVHNTVTLASLVEKEGKLPEERPRIASVFANRLRIGMKLDCDPTTIYAALLAGNYRGTIYKSDLASEDPYNTYRHAGLPPGPIANPGLDAIRAALDPAQTDYLYFVRKPDNSGAHTFSASIAEHDAATAKYRRAAAQQQKDTTSGIPGANHASRHR